jgi:hypothetical protein
MNSWLQFLRSDPILAKLILQAKRAAPAELFDSWLAWGKGLNTETVRQKISELGSFVPNSGKS